MSNFQAWVDGTVKPATKKALREALAAHKDVRFEDTSAFDNRGVITAAELSPSDVIVGPCVYTKRNWYANIKDGKVV